MKKNYPVGRPIIKNKAKILIGAYWCPIPTDKAYRYIAESGINHMLVNTMIGHEKDDEGYYLKPFAYGKKYGVNIFMHCSNNGYRNIKEYSEIFHKKENFKGVLAVDEPQISRFDFFAEDYNEYKKEFPNYPYYINVLPSYASTEQMGTDKYDEYLKAYKEKLLMLYDKSQRKLMCDCYPLKINSEIYSGWLKNIEQLREMADECGADLHLYLQAQGFCTLWRQPTKVSELTYQAYVYLAYGVKGLWYYPYRMPRTSKPFEKSAVTYRGRKTYMYDFIKTTNEEISAVSEAYLDFEWKCVIACNGKKTNGVNVNFTKCKNMKTSYGVLKEVESASDAIIGCFENAEGYQAFMVVNFNEPLKEEIDTIKLKTCGVDKAIVYQKGVPHEINIVNGEIKLELGAGEGNFVIPIKIRQGG